MVLAPGFVVLTSWPLEQVTPLTMNPTTRHAVATALRAAAAKLEGAPAPAPPYENRPSVLLDQTPTQALWQVQSGSKTSWMITDHEGKAGWGVSTFNKKRDALANWEKQALR